MTSLSRSRTYARARWSGMTATHSTARRTPPRLSCCVGSCSSTTRATHVPRSVILPGQVEEPELISGWLTEKRGRPVTIEVPRRGRKRALVTQLAETAKQELEQLRIQADYDRSRTEPMLAALAEALDLESPPKRIECYNISNIQGDSAVGSMVVFEDGRPRNDHYRHFRIKFTPGPNDFAMLQEVLRRRLERLESAQRREEADIVGH